MKNVEKYIMWVLIFVAVGAIGAAVYFGITFDKDKKDENKQEDVLETNKDSLNNKTNEKENNVEEENNSIADDETNDIDFDNELQNIISNKQVLEKYKKVSWYGDLEYDNCGSVNIYTENFKLTNKFKQCIALNAVEIKSIDDDIITKLNKIFKDYEEDINEVELASGYFTIEDYNDMFYKLFNEKKLVENQNFDEFKLQCPMLIYKDGYFLADSGCGGYFGTSIEKFNIKYEEKDNEFFVYETVGFSTDEKIYVDYPIDINKKSFDYNNNFDINQHSEFHTYKYIFNTNSEGIIYLSEIIRIN